MKMRNFGKKEILFNAVDSNREFLKYRIKVLRTTSVFIPQGSVKTGATQNSVKSLECNTNRKTLIGAVKVQSAVLKFQSTLFSHIFSDVRTSQTWEK